MEQNSLKFIENIKNTKTSFGRYLLGTFLLVVAVILGQIPFTTIVASKVGLENLNDTNMFNALEPNQNLTLMLLPFAIGIICLFFVVLPWIHGQKIVAVTTSRSKIDWRRVWFAFALLTLIILATTALDIIIFPEDFRWNFDLSKFVILILISITLLPLQTSFEEYLFRGYLMQGLGILVKNRWFPLLITSIGFGLLHLANPEIDKLGNILVLYYIGTGLFLGIITLMDEGMELALGVHAANNMITALLVTADWTALQTNSLFIDISEPALDVNIVLPILIIYPTLLYVFAKRYNWSDWKEKLFGRI